MIVALFLAGCLSLSPEKAAYTGTIEVTEINVAAAIPGRLTEVRVEEGTSVQEGDVLFVLDSTIFEVERDLRGSGVDMAGAAVEAAQAKVRAADAQVSMLKRELDRVRSLEEAGVGTEQQSSTLAGQLEVAQAQAGAARKLVAQAKAGTEQAKAGLKAAETRLDEAQVAAMVSGVVLSRNREPGEVVAPGMSVVTLGDLAHPWLRVYVPLNHVEDLALGEAVEVRLDAHPEVPHVGKIKRIAAEAEFTPRDILTPDERVKRVFAVDIGLNVAPGLHPGMPAEAFFAVREGQ
ncbi:MAG: HlyD family efflux transporter periplasmic adaptor subunit [Proteobacteria bacterium]|jgi:HlyD family secretion protein|nr:HlyD family efflux transporter periplasmic adaptor subunit [Pseudomonadota bacterium]